MRFDQLSKKDQAKFRRQFEESTVRAMEKYDKAPSWLKSINPLQAAIVDGDFDQYSNLLDQLSDADLAQEMIAPGTSKEFKPEDFYYERF